jgi:hypothetical protein
MKTTTRVDRPGSRLIKIRPARLATEKSNVWIIFIAAYSQPPAEAVAILATIAKVITPQLLTRSHPTKVSTAAAASKTDTNV